MALRLGISANVIQSFPVGLEARINAAMRASIARSTRVGRRLAYQNTNKRTGRTARTVGSQLIGSGSRVSGHFGSDSDVFEYLERGTPAHTIRPRRAKALYWPGAAHPVKMVRHPGTRAYRQLERAGKSAGAYAKQDLRTSIGAVLG